MKGSMSVHMTLAGFSTSNKVKNHCSIVCGVSACLMSEISVLQKKKKIENIIFFFFKPKV